MNPDLITIAIKIHFRLPYTEESEEHYSHALADHCELPIRTGLSLIEFAKLLDIGPTALDEISRIYR